MVAVIVQQSHTSERESKIERVCRQRYAAYDRSVRETETIVWIVHIVAHI